VKEMSEDGFLLNVSRTPSVKSGGSGSAKPPSKVPKLIHPGRTRKNTVTSTPSARSVGAATPKSISNRSVIDTPMTGGGGANGITSYVACVIEYRNRLQVGIALMNQKKPELFIYQFNDNRTYDSTMSVLNFYDPKSVRIATFLSLCLMHFLQVLLSDTASKRIHLISPFSLKYCRRWDTSLQYH
jgi:hypothetical protein